MEAYLLSPFMRRAIRQASTAGHLALSAAMVAAATGLLLPLSPALAALFLAALAFVTLLCPRWLVNIHKFKAKINGPWDEATPHTLAVLRGRSHHSGQAERQEEGMLGRPD